MQTRQLFMPSLRRSFAFSCAIPRACPRTNRAGRVHVRMQQTTPNSKKPRRHDEIKPRPALRGVAIQFVSLRESGADRHGEEALFAETFQKQQRERRADRSRRADVDRDRREREAVLVQHRHVMM